jgi:tight adherence protein C
VWYALLDKHPMERRARMLATRRDELRGQMLRDKGMRKRQKESLSSRRQVVAALKLLQTQQTDKLHDRLSQAGLRSRDAIIVFLFFKVAMPVLLAAVTFLLVYLLEFGDLSPGMRLLAVLGGAVLGFFVPELYVSNLTGKRQLALSKALPDGLDLLVICAESGLSLDAALDRVANEIGGASPALAEELSLTSIELGFLPERRQALLNLERVGLLEHAYKRAEEWKRQTGDTRDALGEQLGHAGRAGCGRRRAQQPSAPDRLYEIR